MKPLVRWVVGPVRHEGLRCLALACKRLRSIYGDNLDYMICHNQMSDDKVSFLESIGVPLSRQAEASFPVSPTYWPEDVGSLKGTRNCWKLHPPRMRAESHEIILDNDIVISGRLPTFEAFLEGDRPMLSEGRARNYGVFDDEVLTDLIYNSGVIGLPPNFSFGELLEARLRPGFQWNGFFDEQGLVAAVLSSANPLVIGFDQLALCGPDEALPATKGIHFIGVNSVDHPAWKRYRQPLL